METTNPQEVSQTAIYQAENSDYQLMIQQRDFNQQQTSLERSKEGEWLTNQFNRAPFLFYKFWLVVNLPIALLFEYILIRGCWDSYAEMIPFMRIPQRMFASLVVSFIFFLYGGCKMLYAIKKRNSKIAQESVVKFQYNLIGSIMGLIFISQLEGSVFEERYQTVVSLYGAFSAPVHLLGGFTVLKVFRKNHPLARASNSQRRCDDEDTDFLQQNEVIGAEISRYDKQLNTWPYMTYKWWLKFVVVFEISLIFDYIIENIMVAVSPWNSYYSRGDAPILIGLMIFSLLNAYSCFEIEVAMRTRTLVKSKRALALLKICSILSMITYLFVTIDIHLEGHFHSRFESSSSEYLCWLVYIVIPPLLTLIGAIKTKKILEKRDEFARISNFTNDSYL